MNAHLARAGGSQSKEFSPMRYLQKVTLSSVVIILTVGACTTPTAVEPEWARARSRAMATTNADSAAASMVESTAGDSTATRSGIGYDSRH